MNTSVRTINGKLDEKRVLRFISLARKTRDVVVERSPQEGLLYIAAGACLLRVPATPRFASFAREGAQSVSLRGDEMTAASTQYAANWPGYMRQFADEETVQALAPTRLQARVPEFPSGTRCRLYCQLLSKREEGSPPVWIPQEIADVFSPMPDDLADFIWQLSPTNLVRAAQVSGWCAVVRRETPSIWVPSWSPAAGDSPFL